MPETRLARTPVRSIGDPRLYNARPCTEYVQRMMFRAHASRGGNAPLCSAGSPSRPGFRGSACPSGRGAEILAPVWLGALGWTVLASLAHALWRGFQRGDWSAFQQYEPPGVDHDAGDCATGTGAYAYRQITDPSFCHLPGNVHYSSVDDSTWWSTDPAYASLPGNIHYHSSFD